jgi:hypothetical protein
VKTRPPCTFGLSESLLIISPAARVSLSVVRQDGDYQRAIDLYKKSLTRYMEIADVLAQATVYKGLYLCYQALHVPSLSDGFKVGDCRGLSGIVGDIDRRVVDSGP